MSNINLNILRDQAYKIACDHGFHDKELSNKHCICLVISELMEAVEADRKGKQCNRQKFERDFNRYPALSEESKRFECAFEKRIKDSVEDELADAVIRLLDFAGLRNLYLNRFALVNVVSKKKTFTENIYDIVKDIMNYKYSLEEQVNYAITQVFALAYILNIDLIWHIEQKMKYNQLRDKMHGKKY